MQGNSKEIISNQSGIHDNLSALVTKHLSTTYRKPYHHSSKAAFDQIKAFRQDTYPIILDSCCGNGDSSIALAHQYADHQIIGVDKSAHRLGKHLNQTDDDLVVDNDVETSQTPSNCLLIRADIVDVIMWLHAEDIKLAKHFLLYPNPWPKAHHLKRRWQGSPIFRTLITLGGALTLRSNWDIYVREFQAALSIAGIDSTLETLDLNQSIDDCVSPFERKFARSNHHLYQLTANLN